MGFLEHVKVGEKPSAKKENAKIDAINALSDRLDTLWKGGGAAGGLRVTIENPGNTPVMTGQPLAVTGCRASGSFEKFVSLYLGGSIPLDGGTLAASSELVAWAAQAIPAHGIGRAVVPGLFAARVEVSDTSHKWAKPDAAKLVSATNGRWRILAKSDREDAANGKNTALCLLWSPAGIRTGQTGSGSGTGDSWTASVSIAGASTPVKCPLLRSGESIDNGTQVVVALNEAEGVWQVIESQCPAEGSGSGSGSGS